MWWRTSSSCCRPAATGSRLQVNYGLYVGLEEGRGVWGRTSSSCCRPAAPGSRLHVNYGLYVGLAEDRWVWGRTTSSCCRPAAPGSRLRVYYRLYVGLAEDRGVWGRTSFHAAPAAPGSRLQVNYELYVGLAEGRGCGAHIIIMLPTRGTRNPAPTDARTSRMGRMKPLGAPFFSATSEKEYCAEARTKMNKKVGKLLAAGSSAWQASCKWAGRTEQVPLMSCSVVCRPASNTVTIKWNSRVQEALEAHACVIAIQMGSTAKSMRMYSSGFQAQVLVKRTSACLRLCHADGHLSKPYAFSSTGSRVQG